MGQMTFIGHRGDLLGLTLVEATLIDDGSRIDDVLSLLGVGEATPELLGTIRCLTNALATVLKLNLGDELALEQVEVWRRMMFLMVDNEDSAK